MYCTLARLGLAAATLYVVGVVVGRCSRFLLLALRTAMDYGGHMAKREIRSRSVAAGVAHGLTQIGTLGASGSLSAFPAPRSVASALKSDWERLGGDMRRAVDTERRRGKADTT